MDKTASHPAAWNSKLITALRSVSTTHIVVLVFVAQLLLVYAVFFPPFSDINPWDESAYIHSGQLLLDTGELPSVGGSPLMAFFYAILILPFRSSPYWFLLADYLGRILLFSLIWWSLYAVARRFSHYVHPLAVMGVFLVAPLSVSLILFPSDPLFAGLAAFSLSQLLSFKDSGQTKHAANASALLGLASLARNDGLILFPIFLLLVLVFSWKSGSRLRFLTAAFLPFVFVVGGYVVFRGAATGDFALGTMERTYENFEVGYGILGARGDLGSNYGIIRAAREVYGTPADNGGSVFTAIMNRPSLHLQRLAAFARSLPDELLRAYNSRFTLVFALLALRGLLELWRKRDWKTLLASALWPAHLASMFLITLVRPGHLMFVFYLVFTLAAAGLQALVTDLSHRKAKVVWLALLVVVCFVSFFGQKLAIFYGGLLFLLALLFILVLRQFLQPAQLLPVGLLIFLAAGLILHGDYPSPVIPQVLRDGRVQALEYLQASLPADSNVGAAAPGVVWASRMNYIGLAGVDAVTTYTPEEYMNHLRDEGVTAIYVDHNLYNLNPWLWEAIQPNIGAGLERVFTADEGDIQILLVKEPDGN